jgi:hypothetical protein
MSASATKRTPSASAVTKVSICSCVVIHLRERADEKRDRLAEQECHRESGAVRPPTPATQDDQRPEKRDRARGRKEPVEQDPRYLRHRVVDGTVTSG